MNKQPLTMHEIQAVSLEILKQVADLCEELNLRYFLAWGTLIGAIRHKGFIPWDDDVDIMMPRPDYDKLLEYLSSSKLPNLTLFNRQTCSEYPYMISRISDDRYILEMENEKSVGMGIFIDIYPMDGMGSTLEEALKFGAYTDRQASLCYQATRDHFAMETTTSLIRKIIKRPVFWYAKVVGKDKFQDNIERYMSQHTIEYDKAEWVGDLVWLSGGAREILKREWLDGFEMAPFEQYHFRIPKMYDPVLKQTYGDYMKLPPETERVGHHYYSAFRK